MSCSHAALAIVLAAGAALAHELPHPKRDLLLVEPERVRLIVVHELNPGDDSVAARALFDRDSDGRLSPAEQDLIKGFLTRVAEEGVELFLDGEKLPLLR